MEIKPIRTTADYRAALKKIATLMSARAGTLEGKRLDALVTLVEAYEKKHPIALALDRFEAIWNKAARGEKVSAEHVESNIAAVVRAKRTRGLKVFSDKLPYVDHRLVGKFKRQGRA